MAEDKDRLGERLKERERAEEDLFFAKRDREALDRLRAQQQATSATNAVCPRCGAALVEVEHVGVKVDKCPSGHGMWVDTGECELIVQRERDSWLSRVLPKLG